MKSTIKSEATHEVCIYIRETERKLIVNILDATPAKTQQDVVVLDALRKAFELPPEGANPR